MKIYVNNYYINTTKEIINLWPKYKNCETDIRINDISFNIVSYIIKYLNIFKNNYFGIHSPLKNKINNKEYFVSLIESGVPKILLDYCNNINNIYFLDLYIISDKEQIPMLSNLLAAFIAYISSIYKWERIHFYYLKYKKINKFLHIKNQEDNIKKRAQE